MSIQSKTIKYFAPLALAGAFALSGLEGKAEQTAYTNYLNIAVSETNSSGVPTEYKISFVKDAYSGTNSIPSVPLTNSPVIYSSSKLTGPWAREGILSSNTPALYVPATSGNKFFKWTQ